MKLLQSWPIVLLMHLIELALCYNFAFVHIPWAENIYKAVVVTLGVFVVLAFLGTAIQYRADDTPELVSKARLIRNALVDITTFTLLAASGRWVWLIVVTMSNLISWSIVLLNMKRSDDTHKV